MRKQLIFIFCLFTGILHAQTPTVTSKCNFCDTLLKVWYYTATNDTEFLESEGSTESFYIEYEKNEITDQDGHFYTVAYGIESTKALNVLYFDDSVLEIHYTNEGKYIGHTLKKPQP